jgi:hypothetical protein
MDLAKRGIVGQTLIAEAHINIVKELGPHLKENITRHH